MNALLNEQLLDREKSKTLKLDAQKEEKRLRSERVKVSGLITKAREELETIEKNMRSMEGMTAAKIEAMATEKATATAKLQALEESNARFDEAISVQASLARDRKTNEDETSTYIANILLEDSKADINVVMEQLLPFWALYSHNNPLQFNSHIAFTRWSEKLFHEHFRGKLEHGMHKQYLDDALAALK
ncbi:MAG: hypothetical protein GQ581_01895 [Methyloprofundus sp.]|nr:hypothetical protein [Methyloprofundus sp.]